MTRPNVAQVERHLKKGRTEREYLPLCLPDNRQAESGRKTLNLYFVDVCLCKCDTMVTFFHHNLTVSSREERTDINSERKAGNRMRLLFREKCQREILLMNVRASKFVVSTSNSPDEVGKDRFRCGGIFLPRRISPSPNPLCQPELVETARVPLLVQLLRAWLSFAK